DVGLCDRPNRLIKLLAVIKDLRCAKSSPALRGGRPAADDGASCSGLRARNIYNYLIIYVIYCDFAITWRAGTGTAHDSWRAGRIGDRVCDRVGGRSPFRQRLRASVRRHRSNLERGIGRALNGQFMYLPTAAWRCGRMRWVP